MELDTEAEDDYRLNTKEGQVRRNTAFVILVTAFLLAVTVAMVHSCPEYSDQATHSSVCVKSSDNCLINQPQLAYSLTLLPAASYQPVPTEGITQNPISSIFHPPEGIGPLV